MGSKEPFQARQIKAKRMNLQVFFCPLVPSIAIVQPFILRARMFVTEPRLGIPVIMKFQNKFCN
jgi:hypothetical protein